MRHSRLKARRAHPVAGPLAAALVAAALLVGVAAVALHESDQAITQDAQARVASNRDAAIRALVRQSTDLKRTVAAYAAEPALAAALTAPSSHSLKAAQQQMALLAASKGAPAVVLSDLRGRNVEVAPARPDLIGIDFSYRDWFKGAQRTGKPYVSAAYRSYAAGAPLAVGISTPVVTGSKRVGYLTIVGKLDAVRAVAEGARQDDGVALTVTDQTGERLTATLPVDVRGQPLPGSVDRGTAQALQGHSVNLTTPHDLAAAGSVPGIGWTVTAALPKSTALAPAHAVRRTLGLSLAASLLLLIVFTGLALRSARRRAAEHDAVEIERARLNALFADSPIGIVECDAAGQMLAVNAAMSAMLGYDPGELLGTHGPDLIEPDKVAAVDADIAAVVTHQIERYTRERVYRAKDGTLVPARTSAILVPGHGHSPDRLVAFIVDQREQKQIEDALRASEDRLTTLAQHDDLTGLANRRLLLDRCTTAFSAARRGGITGTTVAALFIDLDGFKPVNDLQGHERGDQLLVEIAADLRDVVRPHDTVARVGGDEFVVLLGSYNGLEHLHEIAERVTRSVRRIVTDGTTVLPVTASVGVAAIDLALEPDARPDQLLSRADTAMYSAKDLGRDRHDLYRHEAVLTLPPQRSRT